MKSFLLSGHYYHNCRTTNQFGETIDDGRFTILINFTRWAQLHNEGASRAVVDIAASLAGQSSGTIYTKSIFDRANELLEDTERSNIMLMRSFDSKRPKVQKDCFGKRFDDKFLLNFQKKLETLTNRDFSVTHEGLSMISDTYWYRDNSSCPESLEFRMSLCRNVITVSRVYVGPRRVGIFTTLMEYIVSWSRDNNVDYITIQSVSTPEMAQWCRKNDYALSESTRFDAGDFIGGDYIYSVC